MMQLNTSNNQLRRLLLLILIVTISAFWTNPSSATKKWFSIKITEDEKMGKLHLKKVGEDIFSNINRKQFAFLTDYSEGPVTNTVSVEMDVLGMLNFCLRNSDTALSGPSRSKILNEATNVVFRSLMIGFAPFYDQALEQLLVLRTRLLSTPCILDPDEVNAVRRRQRTIIDQTDEAYEEVIVNIVQPKSSETADVTLNVSKSDSTSDSSAKKIENCDQDLTTAQEYMQWLEDLVRGSGAHQDVILGGIYDRGYKRLLTLLRDLGCQFPKTTSSNRAARPQVRDRNICLSLADRMSSSSVDSLSKTQELNYWSNIVARCILYGKRNDRLQLALFLNEYQSEFISYWSSKEHAEAVVVAQSQEVTYLKVLVLLLTESLSVVEKAINAPIVDLFMVDSSPSGTSRAPNLRLFDNYQTAVHRIIDLCISEMGDYPLLSTTTTSSSSPSTFAPNMNNLLMREEIKETDLTSLVETEDFVLQSFLQWERGLRQNLTSELWNRHPSELFGSWEVADVIGAGSLTSIMTTNADELFDNVYGLKIAFGPNGQIEMQSSLPTLPFPTPSIPTLSSPFRGVSWQFTPGPAHLDTLEFWVTNTQEPHLSLQYIGFIDRGQRIESRFSKNPIKMTGRIMSRDMSQGGDIRGSSRFVAILKRK